MIKKTVNPYTWRFLRKRQKNTLFDKNTYEWYTRFILSKVGDLMIYKTDISNLKTDIIDRVGQKIIVKGSLGRSKEFEKEGTIEKAYSNIFVVKYEENNRTASYTYTDILTRTVEVDVFDGDGYNPLVPPVMLRNKRRNKEKAQIL